MTMTVSVPTFRDGQPGGESMTLTGDEDVTRLAQLLAQPWADSGSIETDTAALDVHLRDGWGYMRYYGDEGFLLTDGDPASPAAPCEIGYPAGSGLPAADVVAALREFVRTGALPASVRWRES